MIHCNSDAIHIRLIVRLIVHSFNIHMQIANIRIYFENLISSQKLQRQLKRKEAKVDSIRKLHVCVNIVYSLFVRIEILLFEV